MATQQALNKVTELSIKEMPTLLNVNQQSRDVNLLKNIFDTLRELNLNTLESHSSELYREIVDLTNSITKIELQKDDFSVFNQILCHFENLKKLLQNDDTIKSIRKEIVNFNNLRNLNLSHNEIKELPKNLSNLKNLEFLDVSYNKLNSLPNCYKELRRLKSLDISNNNFKIIPKCIASGMETLRILNISENFYIEMNVAPYSKCLEIFYAKKNKFCKIFPDWILRASYFNLKELYIDETKFEIFTSSNNEKDLSVKILSISNSNLSNSSLEKIIKCMANLEKINVGNNDVIKSQNMFDNIPIHAFKYPHIISEINFSNTTLSSVTTTINQLQNLKKLDLSHNIISWFPEEICELYQLEYLNIDNSKLIMFPKNIGNLKSLQEIKAANNLLENLPKSFKNLKYLKFFDLYNNNFEELPNVLSEISSLKGFDIEQNYLTTDDIKINEVPYSILYKNYSILRDANSEDTIRYNGRKYHSSISSDNSSINHNLSDNEVTDNTMIYTHVNIEENWDSISETDSTFDPGTKRKYKNITDKYILDITREFCPADLHSKRITDVVASMRKRGLLPIDIIEEGQFDDA